MAEDFEINLDDIKPKIKPTLFDINNSFNILATDRYKGIVGEEEARMVVFTNFILGEKPVILKGSRASGKSNIINVVSKFARNPIDIASSSEKAYQRNKNLNEHSHFVIPEINKVNEKTVEMLKDFGEGAAHQYTFTNPYKQMETITIAPKPFITSIADENENVNLLGEELLSRLTVVRTDSGVEQNIKVIEEKLKRAENPNYKKDVNQKEVEQLVDYVKMLPSIRMFEFVYPAGTAIRSAIPPLFTDSRRDTDKYLSNTYGITLFYSHDRIKVTIGNKDYLVVTPADIWYNHRIYQNILLESSLKCGKMEQDILMILKDFGEQEKTDNWGNKVKGMKINDIHTELLRRSYTPTIESVTKMCTGLMEIGYIIRNEEVKPHRYSINPELKREYKVFIDWNEIVATCKESVRNNLPQIYDEYVRRFCQGEGLKVIDPFTGEQKNILDSFIKEESRKPINSGVVTKDLNTREDWQKTGSSNLLRTSDKDDISIEISIEDNVSSSKLPTSSLYQVGKKDVKDEKQDKILEVLIDNKTFTLEEISERIKLSLDMTEELLNYLISIAEVYKKNNYYGRLN